MVDGWFGSSMEPDVVRKINTNDGFADLFRELFGQDVERREIVAVFVLDNMLNVRKYILGGVGDAKTSIFDIKYVMREMICTDAATRFVVVHNHTSGNLNFSKDDIKLAEKIMQAAELFDLEMVDFMVVTANGYNSIDRPIS